MATSTEDMMQMLPQQDVAEETSPLFGGQQEDFSDNLAEKLDEDTLLKIGMRVYDGYKADVDSRGAWLERNEMWLKLAAQVMENKNTPWPNAANVKYPLLTTAVGAFAARAYPAMVPGPELVRGIVIGRDRQGKSADKARRIGMHMSYQLLCKMQGWEDDHDRMGYVVGLVGNAFKKTYFDPRIKSNVSELVLPKDLVVNYLAKSIEAAPRKTHVMMFSRNDMETLKRRGFFLDVEFKSPEADDKPESLPEVQGVYPASSDDSSKQYVILEQHTFYDLDEDGYEEPVVITIEEQSKKVVRIAARYDEDDVERNENNEIVYIEPEECFTNYIMIPDVESGVYGVGLGMLIGPVNEAGNTLLNQLIDSGSFNSLPAGFIGKGAKIPGGGFAFRPGKWLQAQVAGDDLRKAIVPVPSKDPSPVLFTLFQTLIGSGEKLASITDIFSGELPGQNTPATVVMTAVDQGTKVFNSIYKRLHRSFNKELKKLFKLNSKHLPESEYFTPQGQTYAQPELIWKGDYDEESYDVVPTADPHVSSDAQQLAKAQALMGLIQLGTINPKVATMRILEAMKQPGIDQLMNVQPQPNPEFELKKMELQLTHQREMLKLQIDASRSEAQNNKDAAKTLGDIAKARLTEQEAQKMGHDVTMDMVDRIHNKQSLDNEKEKIRNDAARQRSVEKSSGN